MQLNSFLSKLRDHGRRHVSCRDDCVFLLTTFAASAADSLSTRRIVMQLRYGLDLEECATYCILSMWLSVSDKSDIESVSLCFDIECDLFVTV